MRPILGAGLVAVALLLSPSVWSAAGRTPGNFSVSSSGAGEYEVPLWIPPGVRSVQPTLTLKYSSQSGLGPFGYGWSLTGLSVIERCPKTWAQDGAPREVRNDLQDRYCLDGTQLRLISGTYGSSGAQYGGEIETFARVISYGVAGNGPQYFVVEQKNGLVYEYGATDNSRIESVGQATIRTWAVNRIRDRSGNAMVFTYEEDLNNGTYRIQYIDYTVNATAGIAAHYRVAFTYEAIPAAEVDTTWQANAIIRRLSRADRIDITHDGAQVRRYELTYETALSSTSRSRLASIQECAGTAFDCLPATMFTYQDGTTGLAAEGGSSASVPVAPLTMDVNGDGKLDLVYSSSATSGVGNWMVMFASAAGGYGTPIDTGRSNTNFSGAISIDYDANGAYDLLVPYSGGTWWVLYGSALGLSAPVDTGAPATGTGNNALATDVDGDGREDLVWADLYGYAGGDAIRYRLRLASGNFSSAAYSLVGAKPTDTIIVSGLTAARAGTGPVTDLNGDGRGDIVYRQTTRLWNSETRKWQYFYSIQAVCSGAWGFSVTMPSAPGPPVVADMNGDARTDIVYYDQSGAIRYRFSTGTSFTAAGTAGTMSFGVFLVLDWDGDGYDDILEPQLGTASWHLRRSTGEALSLPVNTGVPFSSSTTSPLVTDVNGDGLRDLAYGNISTGTWNYRLHAGAYPDLLKTAYDGYGIGAMYSYGPIAQGSYTKNANAVFPQQDYIGPLQVVTQLVASTGVAAPSTFTQSFSYAGATRNLQGRGFEGFDATRARDHRSDLLTYTYYYRGFPLTGIVRQEDLVQANDVTLIRRVQNSATSFPLGVGYETRAFPYVSRSIVDAYEFGGARNGAWLVRRQTDTVVDGYGTPTSITTTAEDKDALSPWYGEVFTSTLTQTITPDTANWCLALPSQRQIQSAVPGGASQTRTESADINYAMCRITASYLEPASPSLRVATVYDFDACGNVSAVTVTGRNPDGTNMASRTTSANYTTTRCQFPEILTNALGQATSVAYRYDLGVPVSVSDPNQLTTSWQVDDFGRRTRETRPDQTYTTRSIAACNAGNNFCGDSVLRQTITETQYANNGASLRSDQIYLDAFDRTIYDYRQSLAGGYALVLRSYDALGRLVRETMPYSGVANGARQWSYDATHRLIADALYTAGGTLDRQTTFAWLGRYVSVTDPKGATTQQYIDVGGHLRRTVDPAPGGTTQYAFGPFDLLASSADPAGNLTSFTYNVRGFATNASDPDRGSRSFTYDSLGEVVSSTDAKSQIVSFTYDLLSRPLTRTEPEGTSTWTWGASQASHNIGQLQQMAGPGYSESYAFDSLGRPAGTTISADTTYQIDYAWHATTGYLDNVTYPTSTAGYRLRAQYQYQYGILNQVRDYNAPSTVWWQLSAIDDRGNPIDEQLGNGVRVLANHDGLTGHLNWRTSGNNAGYNNHQNLSYQWDANENLTSRADLNQSLTEAFYYDALNRLDYSTRNGVTNLDVTLDAIGNIQYRSGVGNYTYHATKRHAVASIDNGWTFTYDGNGNMLTGRGQTMTWKSYDLPASITSSGLSSQFDYTPDRRYWQQTAQYSNGPETTIYVGGLLEKVTGSTTIEYRHYLRAGSARVVVIRSTGSNNNTYYVTQDHLGSSAVVTNSAAAVVVSQSFGAYGERRGSDWSGTPSSPDWTAIGNSSRRGYTGHTMLDNLSLIHMNGRVYDPLIGRFLSADPFIDAGAGTQGFNRYSYVGNNPLAYTDPSGFAGVIRSWIDGPQHPSTQGQWSSWGISDVAPGNAGGSVDGLGGGSGSQTMTTVDLQRFMNYGAPPPGAFGRPTPWSTGGSGRAPPRAGPPAGAIAGPGTPSINTTACPAGAARCGSVEISTPPASPPPLLEEPLVSSFAGIDDLFGVAFSVALNSVGCSSEGCQLAVAAILAVKLPRIPQKGGAIQTRYGPVNSGPLPMAVANTFRGGSYTATTLSEATTFYRAYGGTARQVSSFWTRTPPSGPLQSRIDLALDPRWGNTATQIAEIRVPAGTTVYEGAAASQSGLSGGGSQVFIPTVNPAWIVR